MDQKVVEFALDFLKCNLGDPDVEAMLAVHLGVVEDGDEYDGGSFEEMERLIEQAKEALDGKDHIAKHGRG